MPTVTVPPRPKGLPTATTHSPTRALSESPSCTKGSCLIGFHLQQRQVGFRIEADDRRLVALAVLQHDLDVRSVFDDVIVGDDKAVRRNHETGTDAVESRCSVSGMPRNCRKKSAKVPSAGHCIEVDALGFAADDDAGHGRLDALGKIGEAGRSVLYARC